MRWIVPGALLALVAAPAAAGIPVTREMTCPIGGERFSFTTTASYSTWGSRPDGRPYGSWEFPLAIPECPGNGFVIYDDFDDAALARLRPLVESADYRALRERGDTTYYRAYWLMRRMDAPVPNTLWALVQAGWQAADGSPLRRRYLEELVEAAALLGPPDNVTVIAIRARIINALRELGRFDEARALLESTPVDTVAPDSSSVRSTADWRGHYRNLADVIVRRDPSIEPIDFIPWRVARGRCEGEAAARLTDAERALCRQVAAEVAARGRN